MKVRAISAIEALREEPLAIEERALEQMIMFLERAPSEIKIDSTEVQAAIAALRQQNPRALNGNVYVIPIQGVITHRANIFTAMFCGTSCEWVSQELDKAMADPAVSRILFDVDSPGGFVGGTPELADKIMEIRDTKPVTAVANTQAASGAYWLASQATEFVASPSAEVGSIGVFTLHVDQSKNLEMQGVKPTYIKAGKYKTEGNPYEPLSDEAREAIQSRVDTYYDMFIKAVARGRGTDVSSVRSGFGQGRVLPAKDALSAGMIDRVMTLEDAIGKRATPVTARSSEAALETVAPVATEQSDESGDDDFRYRRYRARRLR